MLAGRLVVPDVAGPSSLDEVVEHSDHPVMLSRTAQVPLSGMAEPQNLTLLIGPEGGWSEREMAQVAVKATLGPRNLRADTAALVALATALARRP
jgi:16S rRNA (uracil1498-N3)-methyltransferase